MSLEVGTLNRRTILYLLAGVLFILVLRFRVFTGEEATAAPVESVAVAEKRLELLRRKAAEVPGREAVMKQAMAELHSREKGMINAPTAAQAQAQLLEIIHRVAAANGFEAKGVDSIPQPKPLGNDYGEVMVTETFTCGIEQLVNFLSALANEPQILSTNEIQINGGNDKKKNVQVRLSLSGVVPRKLVPEKKGASAF
jgi:Tfp pilus assembly protein PilO